MEESLFDDFVLYFWFAMFFTILSLLVWDFEQNIYIGFYFVYEKMFLGKHYNKNEKSCLQDKNLVI